MLPVNAVGERLEGKPHEPFDGEGLEMERIRLRWRNAVDRAGKPPVRTLPTYGRPRYALRQPFTLHRTHGSRRRALETERGGHGDTGGVRKDAWVAPRT